MQVDAPAAEYVPVSHVWQAAELVTAVAPWYFPAVQPVHVPAPDPVL